MNDSALNAIKVFSMFLGSLFGVLGTLKDFSKASKARKWMWITIAGIVVTGSLSVVIQDFEFHQAQIQKQKDEESVKKSAQTLDDITTRSKSILGTTTQTTEDLGKVATRTEAIQGDLKGSLDAQQTMLTQINSSAETLSGVAQSIVPALFRLSLHYDIAPDSCLAGFGEEVRSAVNSKTAPKDSKSGDMPAEVVVNPATGASRIGFDNTSPILLLQTFNSKGLSLLGGDIWVRFHKRAPGIQFGAGVTQDDGIEYILKFDVDAASQDVGDLKGYLPTFHGTESMGISYVRGVPKELDFAWEGVNVYNNNDAPVLRSADALPGTVLELVLGGCAGRPRIDEFEMAWGPNYSYSSNFDASKFSIVGSSPGTTSYVYYPEKSDFHFGLY